MRREIHHLEEQMERMEREAMETEQAIKHENKTMQQSLVDLGQRM